MDLTLKMKNFVWDLFKIESSFFDFEKLQQASRISTADIYYYERLREFSNVITDPIEMVIFYYIIQMTKVYLLIQVYHTD